MILNRIIPCLLLKGESLVKTIRFGNYNYIGDPLNTCRIFNELEVDEMTILDITATNESRGPNFKLLESLASECFMPLSYGGGITRIEEAERLFYTGYEKIVLNTSTFTNPKLIPQIAKIYGSQSIIASIDVKTDLFRKNRIYSHSGTKKESFEVLSWVKKLEDLGVGEILLTSINREGTWSGFDLDLIEKVSNAINIPLIAHGGAGDIEHIASAIKAGASAVGVGSMVVYQKKDLGVLVNFPDKKKLKAAIEKTNESS